MFEKYFILQLMMNQSGGTSTEATMYDDEKKAIDKFRDKASQLGGNPQTKFCNLYLYNPNGDVIKFEAIDNAKYGSPSVVEE